MLLPAPSAPARSRAPPGQLWLRAGNYFFFTQGSLAMTCTLKRPEPKTLWDRIASMFTSNVLGGGTLIPESNEWYVVSNDYAAAEAFYSISEAQWRERDPRYACCDNLVDMAAKHGIYPRPATFAQGYALITGTAGATMPVSTGLEIVFGDGTYRLAPGVTLPATLPSNGRLIVRLMSVEPGVAGNGSDDVTAVTGRMVAPISGLSQDVTIYGGQFCGGADAETCEQFRARYLRRLQYAPKWDYARIKETLLEWPCLTRVCLRNCDCCTERGSFRAFVFFDNTFENGIPPPNVVTEVNQWFFGDPPGFGMGQAEWGMLGELYAAVPITLDISVDNLPCTSQTQLEEIKKRILAMFEEMCPGNKVCLRTIDAIIVQVLGNPACEFETKFRAPGKSDQWLCDDYCPACEELPVPGAITLTGGALRL